MKGVSFRSGSSVFTECPDVEISDAQDGDVAGEILVQIDHHIAGFDFQASGIGGNGLAQESVVRSGYDLRAEIGDGDITDACERLRAPGKQVLQLFRHGGVFRGRPAAETGFIRKGGGNHHNEDKNQDDQLFHGFCFLSCSLSGCTLSDADYQIKFRTVS